MSSQTTLEGNTGSVLAEYDRMRAAIAVVYRLDEAKEIRDWAEELRVRCKQIKASIEDLNMVAEIKLRAERRAGELVSGFSRAQGARTDLNGGTSDHDEPKLTLKQQLKEADIDASMAKRWQTLATLPEDKFDAIVDEVNSNGAELTSNLVLRKVQEHKRERNNAAMQDPGYWPEGKYRVFYADPPWQHNDAGVKTENDNYGVAGRHYPTMPTDKICEMGDDVLSIALPNSVLFVWATVPMLPEGLQVMAAWGFKYKTHFVWDKLLQNWGNYSGVRHEVLLLGTRGSCRPDIKERLPSVLSVRRSNKHSEKPEEFRKLIDTLYPYGPRLELFATVLTPGWEVWGNAVESDVKLAA